MSIIFRKRPDHTLSAPEAKEPHLDLHSIDAGQADALDDDDIPVLLPSEPSDAVRHTLNTPVAGSTVAATGTPSPASDRAEPILKREDTAVHIPAPSSVARHAPTPIAPQPTTHAATPAPPRNVSPAPPHAPEASPQARPDIHSPVSTSELPGHPTTQDYAPFLSTAKNRQDPHNKPELYVWSDDDNDAFAQAARRDFTLNRIEPTAGRPPFDASLFRAPSRPDALAATVPAASASDPAAAMQAEIDALVSELLDESHDYLKRRFLEEIPEIIEKYRQS